MNIPITEEKLQEIVTRKVDIQSIVPELTPDQREFLISGIPPHEWPTSPEE